MKMTSAFVKSLVLFCFLSLLTATAIAQSVTITVANIQGSVEITRFSSSWARIVKVSANDNLMPGDIVKTNANSRVVLKLSDNSQAIISEKSTVEIKDTTNSPRTIFNVIRGKTRVKIEKLGGKPNPYRVTTPTTVIAVRGTEFDVLVKDEETKVYVNEGEVSVTSIALTKEVILTPGNFTQVRGNQPPAPPIQFRPEQNDRFFQPRDDKQGGNSPNGKPENGRSEPSKNGQPGQNGGKPSMPPSSAPPTQGGAPLPQKRP